MKPKSCAILLSVLAMLLAACGGPENAVSYGPAPDTQNPPEYEIIERGHRSFLDRYRQVSNDSTLTREQKKELHKAQFRHIFRGNR